MTETDNRKNAGAVFHRLSQQLNHMPVHQGLIYTISSGQLIRAGAYFPVPHLTVGLNLDRKM